MFSSFAATIVKDLCFSERIQWKSLPISICKAMIKLLHCVLSCATVDAEIRPSEERPRDWNEKVRQDDALRDRIPLGSNEPLSLHASSSVIVIFWFIPPPYFAFCILSLLAQHFYLSLHYPSKPVVFQHLLLSQFHPFDLNLLISSWMSAVRLLPTGCFCIFHWWLFSQL